VGEIEVVEQCFRHGRSGASLRPFVISAGVHNRGYSRLLQRAITDFGADVPFGQIPDKLQEHYGLEVPASSARQITQRHGAAMRQQQVLQTEIPERPGVGRVIAELDGSMIPLVKTDSSARGDRRRTRQLEWREVRLAHAYRPGSVRGRFGATLEGPEPAGAQWADCVIGVGAGSQTKIHALGDGASWIAQQAEQRFGTQATFLIDFYHLCEYLAPAAPHCAPQQPQRWLEEQKQLLRESRSEAVQDNLAPFLEHHPAASRLEAPVQACYRYLENRPGQFDYQRALAVGLPIGSGAVESAHRYVIQQRLKMAGAWWNEDNAAKMIQLRVVRANQEWEAYWQNQSQKAA
jgi:hypothetical protein